jgi:hypothetical protein
MLLYSVCVYISSADQYHVCLEIERRYMHDELTLELDRSI